MTRLYGEVIKGWGKEDIWVSDDKYCSKFMHFISGAKFSMHYHATKEESWYVLGGRFIVRWIDTKDASMHEKVLNKGDTWHNFPLVPHQLECISAGTVLEVSTADSVEDNYRVQPGDSQK